MIGIFGQYNLSGSKDINIKDMKQRVFSRFEISLFNEDNFAACLVNHKISHGSCSYKTNDGSIAIFIGEVFNFSQKNVKNIAHYLYNILEKKEYDKLAEINGLFSAVVYRKKINTLSFVSDRLGSWPLFIYKNESSYIFSNNLYLLLGHNEIKPTVNKNAIVQLFTYQRTFGSNSNVEDIKLFSPATVTNVNKNGVEHYKYWQLEFRKPAYKKKELPFILAESLKEVLIEQAEGGLLLSGGLDSRLILAGSGEKSLSCWTTASYEENPELKLARSMAEKLNFEHKSLIVNPSSTLDVLDETVIANNGIYPASTQMSAFLPRIKQEKQILLTGHGLDYMFRGYYLPSRYFTFLGANTRFPMLKKFNKEFSGKLLLQNLRQGPPLKTVSRIFGGEKTFREHRIMLEEQLESDLNFWLNSAYPENAWDAFILNSVSQHYAFTSMMAIRDRAVLRIPAFDNRILDIYLNMLPEWRISGDLTFKTLKILSPTLSNFNNANTLMSANINPFLESILLILRGGLRKFGIINRPNIPTKMHSSGSWQNSSMLYRMDRNHINRFKQIKNRLDWLSCGIFSADAMLDCINEHLNNERDHTKLLRQILTHDAWMRIIKI